MRPHLLPSLALVCPLLSLASAHAHAYGFEDDQRAFEFTYLSTPISLHGRVVDERGEGLDGAQLRVIGWGEGLINDGEATSSWFSGELELSGLARRNVLVEIVAPGYYPELRPVELQQPIDEDTVELGEIVMVAQNVGRVRLTFAGDAMFGRRMFDRGLLHGASVTADTAALFRYLEPLLWADDHTAINLETPVTERLATPHPSKSFVFHALPGSAMALPGVGVDSVSLGNNHVYDYLDAGLFDTFAHLDAAGLPWYGAGLDASDAAASRLRTTIRGVPLSFQGFCDIRGALHGARALELVAGDRPRKAGALHAGPAEIDAFVTAEVGAGRGAIPIFHGGIEYVEAQSDALRADLVRAVERGAALVVAHHPHVVHGVQLVDGPDGPRYVLGSLGNFVFDQDIFETLPSYLAVVDVHEGDGSPRVERVRLVPIARDGYVPRLLVGDALAEIGREVAHRGTHEALASGARSAVVFAEHGQLVVRPTPDDVVVTDLLDRRTLALVEGGTGVVSLDRYTPTDALAGITSETPASCQIGRDRLFGRGRFEDPDVDDRADESELWSLTDHRIIQGLDTHAGVGALALLRDAAQVGPTTLAMLQRVAVSPGARLTVHGWHRAVNAGRFTVRVRWLDAEGSTLAYRAEHVDSRGDFDWSPFAVDLTAPAGVATMMIDFTVAPPDAGEGRLVLDDLALIEWRAEPLQVDPDGVELPSPNNWGFVRCQSHAAGPLALTLRHRSYATVRPRYVARVPAATRIRRAQPGRRGG